MKDIQLYEVKSVRGDIIFSLYDPDLKWVWTERSELAARQVATEKGYRIIEGGQITHAEMLRLIGQAPPEAPKPVPIPAASTPASEPAPAIDLGKVALVGTPVPSTPASTAADALPPGVIEIPAKIPTLTTPPSKPKFVYHWDDEEDVAIGTVSLKPTLPVAADIVDIAPVGPLADVFQTGHPLQAKPPLDASGADQTRH